MGLTYHVKYSNLIFVDIYLHFNKRSHSGLFLHIAHVCTSHGFGHLTRQIALADALHSLGCQASLYCQHPHFVKKTLPSAKAYPKTADIGVIQHDSLHVDVQLTSKALFEQQHALIIDEWARELHPYDLVIADIPPHIFAACRKANIPVLGVGNFDWVWIYQQFPELQKWAQQFAQWQEGHDGVQLLPGPPLSLNIKAEYKWLARKAQPCVLPNDTVLVAFGGLGMAALQVLPVIPGVLWVFAPPAPHIEREDFLYLHDHSFPSLVESASIVLSKSGYGILAEGMRSGTPQIWMHRPMFPESRYLEAYAKQHGDIILTEPWGTAEWSKSLTQAVHRLRHKKRKGQPLDNDRLAQWIVKNYS